MKKLILVFAILFALSNSLTAQLLIGKVENGGSILTLDKNKLLSTYNANLLKASNIDGKFTNVSIKTNANKQYFLVFEGEKYKSTFSVQLKGEAFYITEENQGTSCTTSDCASKSNGCVPIQTSCTPCANGGKCTKTVSGLSLLK